MDPETRKAIENAIDFEAAQHKKMVAVCCAADHAMTELDKHFHVYEYEKSEYVVRPDAEIWHDLRAALMDLKTFVRSTPEPPSNPR
jgi:hypothetical protein